MAKLTVISATKNGDLLSSGYLCTMSDGSQWSCDPTGERWFQEVPAPSTLSVLFDKNGMKPIQGKKDGIV